MPTNWGIRLCWEEGWGQGPREVPQGPGPTSSETLWGDSAVWLFCCPSGDMEQTSYDSLFSPDSRRGGWRLHPVADPSLSC